MNSDPQEDWIARLKQFGPGEGNAACVDGGEVVEILEDRNSRHRVALERWKATPCIVGRTAAEADLELGAAAFFVVRSTHPPEPHSMRIPSPGIHRTMPPGGHEYFYFPVYIIQAERVGSRVLLGYRRPDGWTGAADAGDIELLDEPDHRFRSPS